MAPLSAAILGCEGPKLGAEEARFFADAQPWGFILFARNVKTPDQLKGLCQDLRNAVGWSAPILIDQEGGRVQRLRGPYWREWRPPMDTIAATSDPSRVMFLRARLIAEELRDVGIDVNCIPTADVARDGTHPFLRNRLYSSFARRAARSARATVDGLLASGVTPVAKHLPGHGAATVDSHHRLPRVKLDRQTLDAVDFAVFRELDDLTLGMTAHVVYEAIDPDQPATLSPVMIDLIRNEIGFGGALMTDDLSMNALPGSMGARAAAARAAGCDLILHCNGERPEMEAVLANCGALDGASAERAQIALDRRPKRQPIDIQAAEAELADLLDGAVYV